MKREKLPGKQLNQSPIGSAQVARICQFHNSLADEDGPTARKFELALDHQVLEDYPEECMAWNDRAAEVFTDTFIDRHAYPGKSRSRILTRFKVHIRTLKEQFSRHIKPITVEKKEQLAHDQRTRSVSATT